MCHFHFLKIWYSPSTEEQFHSRYPMVSHLSPAARPGGNSFPLGLSSYLPCLINIPNGTGCLGLSNENEYYPVISKGSLNPVWIRWMKILILLKTSMGCKLMYRCGTEGSTSGPRIFPVNVKLYIFISYMLM